MQSSEHAFGKSMAKRFESEGRTPFGRPDAGASQIVICRVAFVDCCRCHSTANISFMRNAHSIMAMTRKHTPTIIVAES